MEQLGERQDFEAELSRLGYRHEDFRLYVRRAIGLDNVDRWTTAYAICVTNVATLRQNIYWGRPGKCWIADFVIDIAGGLYGPPTLRERGTTRFARPRPRLVARDANR